MFNSGLGLSLLVPTSSFETFKMFNIPLSATAVAVHGGRLIAICSNTLKVFSFDSTMSLRPIHTYNMTYSLTACAYLPSSVITLVAKILLNLLNNGVQLVDAEVSLSRLMDTLKFDTVRKVYLSNHYIALNYQDGACRWFDGQMNEIPAQSPNIQLVVKKHYRNTRVLLDSVLLLNRPLGRVSTALCHGSLIILQKPDSLVAIVDQA